MGWVVPVLLVWWWGAVEQAVLCGGVVVPEALPAAGGSPGGELCRTCWGWHVWVGFGLCPPRKKTVLGVQRAPGLGILWLVTLGPQVCAVEMDFLSSCAPYKEKLCRSMHLLVWGSDFGVSSWDISSC